MDKIPKKPREATVGQVLALQIMHDKAFAAVMPCSFERAEELLNDPTEIFDSYADLYGQARGNKVHRQAKREWSKFYRKHFGIELDFSKVVIPEEYDPEEHFAIIVAKDSTQNRVVVAMRKKFQVILDPEYKNDLDATIDINDRVVASHYCVLAKRNVVADPDRKELSVERIDKSLPFIKKITLLERLYLELYYFSQTGKHLDDAGTVTLCAGSRRHKGELIPSVEFNPNQRALKVGWYFIGSVDDKLRIREVFLPKKKVP